MRNRLLGSVRFFDAPDQAGGGAGAPAVAAEPAAAGAATPADGGVASPAGAAPATPSSSSPPGDGGGPAAGEPAKTDAVAGAHAEPTMLEGAKAAEPAKVEAPAVDPAKAAEAAKAGEVEAPKVVEPAKVEEAAKVEEPAKADEPPPVVEPVKYEFKFPEGLTVKDEQLAPAIEVLREAGVKPELAQKLMDQHVGALQEYATHVASEQQRIWQDTRAGWRNEVMSDTQIGGAGHQTAMQAIARMRDTLVHSNDMPAFNEFLRVTGAGDHPMFLKLLHNASRYLDEPAGRPADGAPPPDAGRKPGKQNFRSIYKDNEAARKGA